WRRRSGPPFSPYHVNHNSGAAAPPGKQSPGFGTWLWAPATSPLSGCCCRYPYSYLHEGMDMRMPHRVAPRHSPSLLFVRFFPFPSRAPPDSPCVADGGIGTLPLHRGSWGAFGVGWVRRVWNPPKDIRHRSMSMAHSICVLRLG